MQTIISGQVTRNHTHVQGACTAVPWLTDPKQEQAAKKTMNAKTYIWEEFAGMICIWFDAEERAPLYKIPRVEGIENGSMRYLGRWECDRPIELHLQEFVENTVDVQHFTPMHGQLPVPWTNIHLPGFTVAFDSKVVLGSDAKEEVDKLGGQAGDHLLYFVNTSFLRIFGKYYPSTAATAEVQLIGPAGLIRFLFKIPDVGNVVLFQTHTPLNDNSGLSQRIAFRWYAEKQVPRLLAYAVVGEWVSNWWADVLVWENKIKRAKPSLVKGDGPIQKTRKWFDQFFTENSDKMLNRSLDW